MVFIGDVHKQFNKLFYNYLKYKSYKDDIIIQVGDFCLGYNTVEYEKIQLTPINNWLSSRNCIMYIIRGNHDDPTLFENDPYDFSNIKLLKDWSIINHNGHKILLVGGAISIDRLEASAGLHNKKWWEGENFPTEFPEDSYFEGVDIVCTHTCPSFVWPYELDATGRFYLENDPAIYKDLDDERKLLDQLFNKLVKVNKIPPKYWAYGHMHANVETEYLGCKFECLDILKFKEITDL